MWKVGSADPEANSDCETVWSVFEQYGGIVGDGLSHIGVTPTSGADTPA